MVELDKPREQLALDLALLDWRVQLAQRLGGREVLAREAGLPLGEWCRQLIQTTVQHARLPYRPVSIYSEV